MHPLRAARDRLAGRTRVMAKGVAEHRGPRGPCIATLQGVLAVSFLFWGACDGPATLEPPAFPGDASRKDAGSSDGGSPRSFPDTGIAAGGLQVTRVTPEHGPFDGGNEVVVRGGGFTDQTRVAIGGRAIAAPDRERLSARRLRIVVPPGPPGPADVTVHDGDDEDTLLDGYVYNALTVRPAEGSVAGGASIVIDSHGARFTEGVQVLVGGLPCADPEIVGPMRLRCTLPAGSQGAVDVTVRPAEGPTITAIDAFRYVVPMSSSGPGIGGGPIEGSIDVTVVDAYTGLPVEDALVMVGNTPVSSLRGRTNLRGRVTLSASELQGPRTLHVAKHCYENTTIVQFDARRVTVELMPWLDRACVESPDPPVGSGGGGGVVRGQRGAYVAGELLWPMDFGAERGTRWSNVPEPAEGEERVAYVYTTQACAESHCSNPDPDIGDTTHRVVPSDAGERGFPYRIFVRPALLAVYAIAGVEDGATGRFTPYVMGVARGIRPEPGRTIEGVDIRMNIPLDRALDIRLPDVPPSVTDKPGRFGVQANIDFGAEGFLVPRVGEQAFDRVARPTARRPFRLFAQPPLAGRLADGNYEVRAEWTGQGDGRQPEAWVVETGVRPRSGEIVIEDFLGIPEAVEPQPGARIDDTRVLDWKMDGASPDVYIVNLEGGNDHPAWMHFVPGDVTRAPIPDFSAIPDLEDIPPGVLRWTVVAAEIPGFDYDELSYSDLDDDLWRAAAESTFHIRR